MKLLIERSPWTNNANHECVVNLSNKQLDRNVTSALGYGLNFALSPGGRNSVEITKGLCNLEIYSDLMNEEVNSVKGVIYGSMKKSDTTNVPKRFMVAINELKKDKNIHMTKADKSGALVILNKSEYIEKMQNYLGDDSTYKEINKNLIDNVNSGFNKKVKNLLKGNESLIKKLCVTSPSLPLHVWYNKNSQNKLSCQANYQFSWFRIIQASEVLSRYSQPISRYHLKCKYQE